MESLMNGAIVIEAALLSFFLALWITWLAMNGLFRLMPVTARPNTNPNAERARIFSNRHMGIRRSNAA